MILSPFGKRSQEFKTPVFVWSPLHITTLPLLWFLIISQMDNSKIGNSKTQPRVLIPNRDLKFFEIQFFKVEGRNHYPELEKLQNQAILYIVV